MKNVLKLVLGVSIFALTIVACQKEEITQNEGKPVDSTLTKAGPNPNNTTPVAYGPDLVVTSITTSMVNDPSSPCGSPMPGTSCGQFVTAQVTVQNIGNAPVTSHYFIKYGRVSGTPALYDYFSPSPTLAPGATHVFNIPAATYSSCSGTFNIEQLGAFADAYNDISETNEMNNRSAIVKYCSD